MTFGTRSRGTQVSISTKRAYPSLSSPSLITLLVCCVNWFRLRHALMRAHLRTDTILKRWRMMCRCASPADKEKKSDGDRFSFRLHNWNLTTLCTGHGWAAVSLFYIIPASQPRHIHDDDVHDTRSVLNRWMMLVPQRNDQIEAKRIDAFFRFKLLCLSHSKQECDFGCAHFEHDCRHRSHPLSWIGNNRMGRICDKPTMARMKGHRQHKVSANIITLRYWALALLNCWGEMRKLFGRTITWNKKCAK